MPVTPWQPRNWSPCSGLDPSTWVHLTRGCGLSQPRAAVGTQALSPCPLVSLAVSGFLPGGLGGLPTMTWGISPLGKSRKEPLTCERGVITLLLAPTRPPDYGQHK